MSGPLEALKWCSRTGRPAEASSRSRGRSARITRRNDPACFTAEVRPAFWSCTAREVSGVLVRNSHPRRSRAHDRGTPSPGRLRFAREQLQRVRHHVERGQHAAPLRRRLPVDDRGVRRAVHTAIELLVVTQPRGQFLGGRPEREQVRKDAPRAFGEERILVGAIGKERRRERERFGLVTQLVAGTPVRRARVERIEDHVAAFGRVELRRVFERRVVHDGGVAAVLELPRSWRISADLPVPESPMMSRWLDSMARGIASAGWTPSSFAGRLGVWTNAMPFARIRHRGSLYQRPTGLVSERRAQNARVSAAPFSTSATQTSLRLLFHTCPLATARTTTRTFLFCERSVSATTLPVLPEAPKLQTLASLLTLRDSDERKH